MKTGRGFSRERGRGLICISGFRRAGKRPRLAVLRWGAEPRQRPPSAGGLRPGGEGAGLTGRGGARGGRGRGKGGVKVGGNAKGAGPVWGWAWSPLVREPQVGVGQWGCGLYMGVWLC